MFFLLIEQKTVHIVTQWLLLKMLMAFSLSLCGVSSTELVGLEIVKFCGVQPIATGCMINCLYKF